jgi:hypothetical protein
MQYRESSPEFLRIGPANPTIQLIVAIALYAMFSFPPLVQAIILYLLIPDFRNLILLIAATWILWTGYTTYLLAIEIRDWWKRRPYIEITPDRLVYSRGRQHLVLPWKSLSEARTECRTVRDSDGRSTGREVPYFTAVLQQAPFSAVSMQLSGFEMPAERIGHLLVERAVHAGMSEREGKVPLGDTKSS